MTHKKKLTLARNLLTATERKEHVAPFGSAAWKERKEEKAKKRLSGGGEK